MPVSGVVVESDRGELVAVRRVDARDPAAVARLRATAARLTEARHPGVVEILDVVEPPAGAGASLLELRTRFAGSGTLASRRLPASRIGPLVAATATTLAALHDRGLVHGRLSPDHVVVAPDGRPVLCGLGDGVRDDGTPATPADDVTALGVLLDGLLDGLLDDDRAAGTVTALRRVARSITPATSAAEVAAEIARATTSVPRPGHRLPHLHLPRRAHRRPARRGPLGRRLLAATAVVLVGGLAGSAALGPSDAARHGEPPATVAGPVASPRGSGRADVDDDGRLDDLVWDHGVLTSGRARWALGTDGDAVLLGDWDCDGRATPALVRAADGAVFVFPEWAGPGGAVSAEAVGTVPDGSALVAPPDGCGPPWTRIGDGTPAPLTSRPEETTR